MSPEHEARFRRILADFEQRPGGLLELCGGIERGRSPSRTELPSGRYGNRERLPNEGTVAQRTELTPGHRRIIGALTLPEPPRFYDFTPAAD